MNIELRDYDYSMAKDLLDNVFLILFVKAVTSSSANYFENFLYSFLSQTSLATSSLTPYSNIYALVSYKNMIRLDVTTIN